MMILYPFDISDPLMSGADLDLQRWWGKQTNMFMSMFSHFEISQAQKWSFSLGLSPAKDVNSKPNKEATEAKVTGKDPKTSTPSGDKQIPAPSRQRFAPELDGLHCFEFIVPSDF